MGDFPHASTIDGARFTAQIGLPNVIQGLFAKRALPTKIASTVGADHQGYLLVEGMVRSYGPGPFYVRVALEEALLISAPEDLEYVLGGSPDPFASDPETKRKGMQAFQPDALTISRGEVWADRRRFAESVLDTGQPVHRLSERFLELANEEADALPRPLRWEGVNAGFRRLTRRIVFGDPAADDVELSDQLEALMSAGNRTPGKPAPEYEPFLAKIQAYLDDPAPGSLAELVADAPQSVATNPAGQLIHWLFATGDTLAANVFRALAAIAAHPEQLREVKAELAGTDVSTAKGVASLRYLGGCLLEAMRLWPTTPLFGRVTTRDVEFPGGAVVKAGTQILIYNVFNHRNRERFPYADRFAPGEWASGEARADWSFNFFSHGPQVCPGADLATLLGQAVLARLIGAGTPALTGATLNPGRPLPHTLDVNSLTVD